MTANHDPPSTDAPPGDIAAARTELEEALAPLAGRLDTLGVDPDAANQVRILEGTPIHDDRP